MKSVEFCYWLQGLFELEAPKTLNQKQTAAIKAHLSMVFKHEIDPSYPKEQQVELAKLHAGNAGGLPPKKKPGYVDDSSGDSSPGGDFLIRC